MIATSRVSSAGMSESIQQTIKLRTSSFANVPVAGCDLLEVRTEAPPEWIAFEADALLTCAEASIANMISNGDEGDAERLTLIRFAIDAARAMYWSLGIGL